MKMFLEALNSFADLDILFYVDPNVDISPDCHARMERLLEKHWGCKARVILCRRSRNTTANIPSSFPFHEKLKEWWCLHRYYYEVASREHLAAFEKCLECKPDAIFVHRLNATYPVLSSRKIAQPIFFDLDDIEHRLFSRSLRQPPFWRSKFLQYLKVPSLIWLERRAIVLAKKTFVCSDSDKNYVIKALHVQGVTCVPNAVDIPPLYELPAQPLFLLLGNYSFEPNVVAADYLLTKIWPTIKSELPDAKLIIAGKNPGNIACFQGQHDGVEFRGFVDDLAALYRQTRVVCCPIQSGSGTRVKIIEAAAHGKAIVSTSLGAEGLDLVDGREIMLRDDCNLFAQTCIRLSKDISLCNRLGDAARGKAIALYNRKGVIDKIQSEISSDIHEMALGAGKNPLTTKVGAQGGIT